MPLSLPIMGLVSTSRGIEFPSAALYPRHNGERAANVVTRGRDLRTGRSVWQTRRAPAVPTAPLRRDVEADVLIIGAGITGAMIADALAATGLSIAMVDKRGPA